MFYQLGSVSPISIFFFARAAKSLAANNALLVTRHKHILDLKLSSILLVVVGDHGFLKSMLLYLVVLALLKLLHEVAIALFTRRRNVLNEIFEIELLHTVLLAMVQTWVTPD